MDTDPTTAPARPDTPAERPTRRRRAADPDPVGVYCDVVLRVAGRIAARKGHKPFDADDIAQRVVSKVLSEPEVVMAKYPDPAEFARRATGNAGEDHRRRERTQRGEGTNGGHTVISWDADDDTENHEGDVATGSFDDPAGIVVGALTADGILGLVDDDLDRALLEQSAVAGDRVTEIAQDRGLSHPTVSRRLARINASLRARLVDDEYVSAS